MVKIGIDFSLISPAVTIYKNKTYHFISFFDDYNKDWKNSKSKKFHYHKELNNIIRLVPYTRYIDNCNYRLEQESKMKSAKEIAYLIISILKEYIDNNEQVIIGLEGFSYGSISSTTLDLALYNSFLRLKLMETFGDDCLQIISPKEGKKKLSDKGNANKDLMIQSFIENKLNDDELIKTDFWKYCSSQELDLKNIKPIDDIVDSFAILKSL